jgi:hypothetical protein
VRVNPVEADVGQQLVAVDRVGGELGGRVGPLLELLGDPGQLAGRRVGQGVGQGLEPGRLQLQVAEAVSLELAHPGQAGPVGLGDGRLVGLVAGREGDGGHGSGSVLMWTPATWSGSRLPSIPVTPAPMSPPWAP